MVIDFSRAESIATIFRQFDIVEVLWVTANFSGDYAVLIKFNVYYTTGASKND